MREQLNIWTHAKNPYRYMVIEGKRACQALEDHIHNTGLGVFVTMALGIQLVQYLTDGSLGAYLSFIAYLVIVINAVSISYYTLKASFLLSRSFYLTWRLHPAQKHAIKAYL